MSQALCTLGGSGSRIPPQTPEGANFNLYELQSIYAAFKENDMRLPREYFNIVYSTYARLDNPVLVGRVFDLFDKNHDGYFEYEGEAHAREGVSAGVGGADWPDLRALPLHASRVYRLSRRHGARRRGDARVALLLHLRYEAGYVERVALVARQRYNCSGHVLNSPSANPLRCGRRRGADEGGLCGPA